MCCVYRSYDNNVHSFNNCNRFIYRMGAIMIDLPDMGLPEEDRIEIEDIIPLAIQQMDAVCDGAATRDDVGFAGMHARTGKKIAHYYRTRMTFQWWMIGWIERALPHYFNTQLIWVDKEEFKTSIDWWFNHLRKNNRDIEVEEFSRAVDGNPAYCARLFKLLDLDCVKPDAWNFVQSLQKQLKSKGWLSPKQMYHAAKYVKEAYWHLKQKGLLDHE